MCRFLDKINTQIWEDFQQFFVTKQGFLAFKTYKKTQFWIKWLHSIYFTKAKSRTLVQNFGHAQNKNIIYWPVIYNLKTRTLTFPDQEKLLEKVDLGHIKTLKAKKLNTKNPQIKHCPSSKYVMINRPDLYNLQTRKKQLKKWLRIETDPS